MMTSPITTKFLLESFISSGTYQADFIVNTQTPNLIHS